MICSPGRSILGRMTAVVRRLVVLQRQVDRVPLTLVRALVAY